MQNVLLTACTLQVHPPFLSFGRAECDAHPACVDHFAHLHEADMPTCCPAPKGDLLACCQFESATEAKFWGSVAQGLELVVNGSAKIFVTHAFVGIALIALSGLSLRVYLHSAYKEFRGGLLISWVCVPVFLLAGLATSLATPWLLFSVISISWVPYATIRIFARFYKFVWRHSDCRHEQRPRAMRKLTNWLWANFLVEYVLAHVYWIADWMALHFLLGEVLRAIGVDSVKPIPFEYTIDKAVVPAGAKAILQRLTRLLWEMHSLFFNVPVHVNTHTDSLAPVLLLIGCMTLGISISSYVLLICNVYGRLAAGRHGFLLAKRARTWRVKQAFKMSLCDFGFTMWMHCSALWIARGQLLTVELCLTRPLPADVFARLTLGTLAVFVLVVYIGALYMWVGVANGTHVEDPPRPIAWVVSRYTGLEFDTAKRQHLLTKMILEAFDVVADEGTLSPGSSPRSPHSTSPRGSPKSSPRGRSSPHGRTASPRSGSPRGMSPRGGSPRFSSPSGSPRSPRMRLIKVAKNLGSAKRLLQRTFAAEAAPATPTSPAPARPTRHTGPHSAVDDLYRIGDVPPPSALPMYPQTFIRLPDLSKASYGRVAIAAARATASSQKMLPEDTDANVGTASATELPTGRRLSSDTSGRLSEQLALEEEKEAEVAEVVPKRTRCKALLRRARDRATAAIARRRAGAGGTTAKSQSKGGRTKTLMSPDHLSAYGPGGEYADQIDKALHKETPMEFYSRMPKPMNDMTLRACCKRSRHAARVSFWTSLGHWKQARNVGLHKVCTRTRDLAEETCRYGYDQLDYFAMARATARTVAMSLRWLPGGIACSVLALYLNWPLFRQCDKSMDIMWHKIQEVMEKGASYKEAEVSLWRSLVNTPDHRRKLKLTRRCLRVQQVLSLMSVAMMFVASLIITGENAHSLAPPVFFVAFASLFFHVAIGQVILPVLMLPNAIYLSVASETAEEKELAELVRAQQTSSDSSASQDSSSEYSSSNESFLDEDRRSAGRPSVIGVKRNRIIIRPQAARLRLRFQLMERLDDCQEYMRKWRRVGPEKHGRLFKVDGKFGVARRPWETVSFQYTENSDMNLKTQRFVLRRCNSIGTSTGEELCELRDLQEHWSGYVDVFDESYRPGLPAMPRVVHAMPDRGVVDRLEAQRVFKEHPNEVTNQQIIFANPLQGTAVHRHFTGKKEVAWEYSYDEMLASFKASVASAASAMSANEEAEPQA